jgi:hypothetical protein
MELSLVVLLHNSRLSFGRRRAQVGAHSRTPFSWLQTTSMRFGDMAFS